MKPTEKEIARRKAAFLEELEAAASVTRAAEKTGVSRTSLYSWRNADEEFAGAWAVALEVGTDALEDEAVRRGHEGVDEPVYQSGRLVGEVRRYSDTLLIFMLKARRPERFRDRPPGGDGAASLEIRVTGGLPE